MKKLLAYFLFSIMVANSYSQEKTLFKSPAYSVYSNRVVQDKYEAKALSATQLQSNYQSPANEFQSADINFKFAINGRDNEMLSGKDHHFTVSSKNGAVATPVIVFGQQLNAANNKGEFLAPNTPLTIKLDLSEVLKKFKEQGFYTTFKGDKIYKDDFKGVYVAGNTAPMIWDFDNLVNRPELQLKDEDGDGIYETTLMLNTKQEAKQTAASWQLSKDVSALPQYQSEDVLANALYNMSLEEMQQAVEPDSTFRTGKEWAGVWTRDISYSIILSMAYLQPQVAKNSLLRKVNKKKRIIQDTGTGGAWPASTDRMIWAVAAYELYKVTGDKDWLQQAYEIVKNSIDDDMKNVYDATTGLVKGESSFLDWREQTYPKWMQPADIYESECLGTNAVHFQANMVLSQMATLLNKNTEAIKYKAAAAKIKTGINTYLWLPSKGYYGQFLYGRNNKILSPRSEALGEALSVVFDIADPARQNQVVASTPLTDYGVSCIYPQIPGIPPYHNNAVWPFVQTYWLWAAAKVGNEKSVMESIAAIYRPAAMFLTNKENFVADNGDFLGTQINSSNMLWSLSGSLSLVHKVIFGIHLNNDNLEFKPFVPSALKGKRTLNNFKYRNAILNIEMEGYGNTIKSFMLDGKVVAKAIVPAILTGTHAIKIVLNNSLPANSKINKVSNYTSLPAPSVSYENGLLSWQKIDGAKNYKVYNNDKLLIATTALQTKVNNQSVNASYQVIAFDKMNVSSFASEPLEVIPAVYEKKYEVEMAAQKADHNYKGFSGEGFVELTTALNTNVTIPVRIEEAGLYAIDFRYANGNGPTNTENKCAIRTLSDGNKKIGTIVLPQRGKEEWSNWGFTNSVEVSLSKGVHNIVLSFEPYNANMNVEINQAMLDYLRVIKIK
ncbi:hypothetical protein BH10BAC3_BH10BAC3_34360 [soil metagenome]